MYLGYNAMDDYFPTMNLGPSNTCPAYMCLQRQEQYKVQPPYHSMSMLHLASALFYARHSELLMSWPISSRPGRIGTASPQ